MNFKELYVETCRSASLAAAKGDVETLKKIVKSNKPTNGEDNKGWRALHHACYNGKIECIKILLGAHDVDINAQTFERETALYLTCCAELIPDLKVSIAKILFDAGADPNYDNKYKYINILNQAIVSCNLSLIKLLISNGADVNVQDDKFGSVLNAAVETQNLEIVELIASHYIHTVTVQTPDTPNAITFFHNAVLQRNEDILRILLRNPQCVKAIDIQDFQLRTCLYLACSVGYRKGIELLLNSVADPNIRSAGSDLPVMAFTEHVQEEDLNSSESLLGQLIRLTNKLEFKKPRQCSSSFFHMLADCEKQDLIFEYVLKHFPDLYSSMIVAQLDNKIRSQSTSFRSLLGTFNLSPLAFWCGFVSSRKNYKFFHKMVELDRHMRDNTRSRIPPLMMASGIEEVDPYVIKYLIRNGSDVMRVIGRGVATKTLPTAFLMGLFSPSTDAISTILINSAPIEVIFNGLLNRREITEDICNTESWIRKYYHDGTHSSTNLLRNLICAFKFIPIWPFDLNILEQRLRPTDQIKDQFNELLKRCEEISNEPKCLWHLACLQARKTIWKKGGGIIGVPMCTSVENFCNTLNLPPTIAQILKFENIILE